MLNHLEFLWCALPGTWAGNVIEVAKKIMLKTSALNYYLKDINNTIAGPNWKKIPLVWLGNTTVNKYDKFSD